MRSSALPRRTALLALFSLIFSALMLTTSLYLHRKALDTTHISFQHGRLVQAPQSDHAEYEGEHRLVTSVVYDVDFEVALRNLIDLTPDEVRAGQLLSPIDYSDGTSMLRDLAVRTRIFGALFTKWESLHIVHSATTGDVSIRENIVEHIRQNFSDDASEAIQRYDQVRSFMNRFSRHLFPWTAGHSADHMLLHASFATGGRGIVITVSDHQIVYVLTSINTFRDLGCKLPVEVFYLGDSDMHEGSRAALAKLPGVTTRDLSKMVYDEGWTLEGWAAKPMAMLLSSFREAILIDADVIFLADPTILLSDPDFTRLGALFFRDRLLSPTSRASFIAKSLPSPLSPNILRSNRWWLGTSGHMQESGVVVVDKWRHFVALLLTTRLNGPDRDGNDAIQKKGVYQMMYGDKETYWLSWEMAGDSDYAFYNGRAGQIGVLTPSNTKDGLEGEEMCGKQLLHISREGRPLWFNGWLSTDKHREDHLTNFQDFKGFIPEPQETLRQDLQYWNGWIVRQGNIMCLTNDGYIPLSAKENETVGRILRTAEEVVASGSW